MFHSLEHQRSTDDLFVKQDKLEEYSHSSEDEEGGKLEWILPSPVGRAPAFFHGMLTLDDLKSIDPSR